MLASAIQDNLPPDLPPAVLLIGPQQVTEPLSRAIFLDRKLHVSDLRWVHELTADIARQVVAEATQQPAGDFLGFIINLTGSSETAQRVLLKTVEEPPQTSRFILLSDKPPLGPLHFRCRGYLVHDPDGEPAVDGNADAAAAAAVRAALTRDPAVLADALRPWGESCGCGNGRLHHDKGEHYLTALSTWAVSQYRPRSVIATGGSGPPAATSRAARTVLRVLSDYPRARPLNAAAAALSLAFLEDG
jgi:hypothetical protein